MIKTSVVRKFSVDDVRGISHLTAIGMMAVDILAEGDKFDYFECGDFAKLINNYTRHCDPQTKSVEYFVSDAPQKRVVIRPAGLAGIKIEYYLGMCEKSTFWSFENYAELADD